MSATDDLAARLYTALTLRERYAMAVHSGHPLEPASQPSQQRFRRWTTTPAFEHSPNLTHFINCHRLTEEQFRGILGAVPQKLATQCTVRPKWLNEFVADLGSSPSDQANSALTGSSAFLRLIDPLIVTYTAKLGAVVRNLNNHFYRAIDEATVIASLSESLSDLLLPLLIRSLILESHIMRLKQTLTGLCPSDRFDQFCQLLGQRDYQNAVFGHYPVLARHCLATCQQWLDSTSEFLARMCSDRAVLAGAFGYSELGPLVCADVSSSDSHQKGRRVIFARFECGLPVVYKPRPLAAAKHFQAFLQWLNINGQKPRLRTITIVDCDSYGWLEFVEHNACERPADVGYFYARLGGLLAVVYCLAGTDCHFQNLVASGSDPVLIDLETLFQPRFASYDNSTFPDRAAQRTLADSVVATGLLPTPVLVQDSIVDLSGIGASPSQLTPLQTLILEEDGTDMIRVTRSEYRTGTVENRATLGGAIVAVCGHAPDLVAGFCTTYDLLQKHRTELLTPGGPLSAFRGAPTRVVVRPTAAYSSLLEESFHPKALTDGLERERVLAQLWGDTPSSSALRGLVFAEYTQMLAGDIPYFSSAPESTGVVSDDGQWISGLFPASGLSVALERIRRLSRSDRDHQLWLIKASLASLQESQLCEDQRSKAPGTESLGFLELAVAIGQRLAELAVQTPRGHSWLSLLPARTPKAESVCYNLGVVGSELYDGLAGITIFLSYLGKVTSCRFFHDLAAGSLKTLALRMPALKQSPNIGAFDGLGGLVYLYTHVGVLRGDDSILAVATGLLDDIARRIPEDRHLDVIGGSAGCILCLLTLHAHRPSSSALEVAVKCGDHLANALDTKAALRYQRGFAHGYSGIATALMELGTVARETRFIDMSLNLLTHERNLLRDDRWTDPADAKTVGQASWCHGAPGIALSRVAICRRINDPQVRADAEAALACTARSFELDNHSLCHGQLGNLEALLMAAQTFATDSIWRATVDHRARSIQGQIASTGWRSACPGGAEVPGLMTGISGIGFELLRLVDPSAIPSVLLLEGPKSELSGPSERQHSSDRSLGPSQVS